MAFSTPQPDAAIPLYPYQKRWFLDRSRFKVGMMSRQIGKTFTSTLELADDCVAHKINGGRSRWVILSRGERQAKEAIEEAKRHCQAMQVAADYIEGDWQAENGATFRSHEIAFGPNIRVTALPANPDTARGFSANVLADEFAFHQDSRAIWRALFPVVSNAGQRLIVVSTPNGKGNKFYELITGDDPIWSRHVVDIHQAVADGLPRDIEALRAAIGDEEAWRQEFLLEFLDEASAWLTFDLINACQMEEAGAADGYQGGPCYVGVDVAARRDLFVIVVAEQVGDVLWTRQLTAERGISFREQHDLVQAVMDRYRVVRMAVDQTGMGEFWVQAAQARWGSTVEGVLFTSPQRLTMATALKDTMEDRRLRLPMGDDVRRDLHAIKRATSATGAPRLLADGDTDGHADRFWAFALAASAAAEPVAEYGYTPVSASHPLAGHNGGPPIDDGRGPWQAQAQARRAPQGRAGGLGGMKGSW